jgi:DNA repair exonuclease SbcCD ATPase subunit
MAEISRTFPPAPASSKQSPARDPRRISRPENTASAIPAIPNVPITLAPSGKPKSYGEKLIESLASLSSEVSTATTLKNEYAKAKKAQIGINQHYEKLRNLSQFPAARDLVGRIRETQNKDVDTLKEQLNVRKENQKNLTKRAAALVDAEATNDTTPSEALMGIQAESRSTKQSLLTIRDDLSKLTKESRANRAISDRKTGELQRASETQSELLQTIQRNQDKDFNTMKRTRDQVENALSEIYTINDRIKSLSYERSPTKSRESPRQSVDHHNIPAGVDQKSLLALEHRVEILERSLQSQKNSASPENNTLTKNVNEIAIRLEAIENKSRGMSGTIGQSQIPSSNLEERVAKAEENIEGIKELMEYKDTILCDDIEARQKKMQQQLEETAGKLRTEAASDLEKAISEVKTSAPIKQDVGSSQGDSAELYSERLESITTGIRSLENRYASLTAEALAHQAIPLIHSQFPAPHVLHGVVERFHVIEMHLAQISRLRDLPQIVDTHGQHLAALQAQATQTRASGEPSTTTNTSNSAALAEMQKKWQDVMQEIGEVHKTYAELKELDSKLSSYVAENQQKHDQLRQILDELKEKDRVIGELTSMSGSVDELKVQAQAQKDQHTALAQSTDRQVQTVEQRLTARVMEIENSIQHVEQKISETLSASGLEDAKQNIVNFEASLQHHVEDLTYQLTQLEDKQKATALELSDLQRAEDGEIRATLEEFAHRIDDLEDVKESIGRRFHDSRSPRSDRSRSPSQSSNWSGGPSRDDDEEINIRAFNYNSRVPPGKKKSKRKFAKVSGSPFASPRPTSFGSTPPRGPMIERTGPPPFKKRQRSMMELVEQVKQGD